MIIIILKTRVLYYSNNGSDQHSCVSLASWQSVTYCAADFLNCGSSPRHTFNSWSHFVPWCDDLLQWSAGGKPLSQFGAGGRRGENGPQFLFLLKNSVYILLILWASILSDADLFQPVVDGRWVCTLLMCVSVWGSLWWPDIVLENILYPVSDSILIYWWI